MLYLFVKGATRILFEAEKTVSESGPKGRTSYVVLPGSAFIHVPRRETVYDFDGNEIALEDYRNPAHWSPVARTEFPVRDCTEVLEEDLSYEVYNSLCGV